MVGGSGIHNKGHGVLGINSLGLVAGCLGSIPVLPPDSLRTSGNFKTASGFSSLVKRVY